jgi:hypothetical protein
MYGERYRARAHTLSPRLLSVARYSHENRDVVLEHTAIEIAAATQTSDATVVRAIQALGFVTRPETDDGALVWADGNLGGKDEYHGRGAVV